MSDLAEKIKQLALVSGYADCGIIAAKPFTEFRQALLRRMEEFPDAAHHYESMLVRTDPCKRSPWARSIIVCVFHYGKYEVPGILEGRIGKNYLFDRRFRGCSDSVVPQRFREGLKNLGLRVKKGSVPDRWAGARAGVTRFGKNNFAYSETFGSWINVEPWLVDADLKPDEPALSTPCPKDCNACFSACPTGALRGPFSMRMDRCIAYLSYNAELPIDPELEEQMGGWIYGCDVCQDVCPMNKGKWENRGPAPWLTKYLERLSPEALSRMDLQTYRKTVHALFWYISDDDEGLKRWRRNAKRSLKRLP